MLSSDWPHGRAKIGKSVGHPKKLFQVSPHTDALHQIGLFTCAIPPQMWYTAQAPRDPLTRSSAEIARSAVIMPFVFVLHRFQDMAIIGSWPA